MSLKLEEDQGQDSRFFATNEGGSKEHIALDYSNLGISGSDDEDADSEGGEQQCVTLRILQKCLPWFKSKSIWEPSQGDVFKMQEVEEIKYPAILRLLERPFCDFIFVMSSVLSVFLVLFSEGFLLESRVLWGIIHCNNFIYTFCVFGMWLEILVKSKYAKTNQGFNTRDTVYSLVSVIPVDIIVLVIHMLNDNENDDDNPVTPWITVSRLVYFIRLRNVFTFFSKWEDHLSYGDFKMFILRTLLYGLLLIHFIACIWHRLACVQFTVSHFRMRSMEATVDVCADDSWIMKLLGQDSPLLRHDWNVLLEHYCVCVYWAVVTVFRYGANDITASLYSDWEVAFCSIIQIMSWIFVIAYVSGSLTSILVEMDTEKENFLTRRFAIERYLDFRDVTREIRGNVNRFYDYLWTRSQGIHNWDLVEQMPITMKAEIYYDVNKFVLDQLPLLSNLEDALLMSLSTYMKHNFYLRGEVLQRRNHNGTAMFYVSNGHLEILSGDESQVICEIRSGSTIGELFLVQSYPVVATVRCGTECDVMTLKKTDFRKILNMYPEYVNTLRKRVDSRLEQSGLLLALCEKHNQYPKAMRTLQMELHHLEELGEEAKDSYFRSSYDMVASVLDTTALDDLPEGIRNSDEYDGLLLNSDMLKRLTRGSIIHKEARTSLREAANAAAVAIEGDVTRAISLARDLNIARPPLSVKAPHDYKAFGNRNQDDYSITGNEKKPLASLIIPRIISQSFEEKSGLFRLWKCFVLLCIMSIVWYYPYQYAFPNHSYRYLDYVAHVIDFILFVDFLIDTLRPVILPHKTLESRKEILAHSAKKLYFYVRIFAFLPIEYVLAPILGVRNTDREFYLLKCNRLILYYEGMQFFRIFDVNQKVTPQLVFVIRFAMRLFFILHGVAVCFEVVLKDYTNTKETRKVFPVLDEPDRRFYEYVYYWASEVLTGTGYGDFPLRDDQEIATTVIGLVIGTFMITYLSARLSAIMANGERRRISFKQTFYCLTAFMKERGLEKHLAHNVRRYYQLQWKSHEGVLIPTEKSTLWDAPPSLFQSVSVAQSYKYVSRIPLFKYCPDALIMDICAALRQYIVPPNNVMLYPGDQERVLYIIVKGFCKVTNDGELVGKFKEGNYFGIMGMLYGTNGLYNIETENYCQFFCLDFERFAEIAMRYPKFLMDYKILRGDAPFTKNMKTDIPPEEWEIFSPNHTIIVTAPESAGTSVGSNQISESEDGESKSVESASMDPDGKSVDHPTPVTSQDAQKSREKLHTRMIRYILSHAIIPYGQFLKWWTVLRVISAFCIGNFVPIQACFAVHPTLSFVVVLIFDIVAWIDLLLCLRIGYYGSENQLITGPRKTAMHYLKGPFVLDLLGCFPLDLIIIMLHPGIRVFGGWKSYGGHYDLVAYCRLNRMLQCYRLLVGGKLLQKCIFRSLPVLILIQVVPLLYSFINIMTCIVVRAVCRPSLNGEITCDKDAWIINGDLYRDAPVTEKDVMRNPVMSYTIGFYWVITSALCVGFGDIDVIRSAVNRKIAIAVIFLGTLVAGYLVSKLTACLVGEDSRRIEIRGKTKVMLRYLEQFGVSNDVRRRVKEYYYSAWDKTKGIYPKDLFYALPPTLKSDTMRALYEKRLKTSPMFASTDEAGIRILASKLTEIFYPEGEFLFEYGDLNGDVFFIAKGLVATYTERGDFISYVGTGSLIGETSCLFETQRLFTTVACTDLEAFAFKKEDFLDFVSLYPNLKVTLEAACIRHYKQAMEAATQSIGLKVIIPVGDHSLPEGGMFDALQNAGGAEEVDDQKKEKDVILNIDSTQSLEMTAAEIGLSKEECEANPEFIDDPLRPSVKQHLAEYEKWGKTDRNNKRWTSWFITFGKVPHDEMGFLHVVQEKRNFSWCGMVFHPLSPLCSWVSSFLFLTSLSCALTSYEIAFSTNALVETTNLMVIRCCLEIFFIARTFGNFHLGYYDEYGVIVTDIKQIIKRYLSSPTGFALDLVTTFPLYLVAYLTKDASTVAADIRGLQLLRVFLFGRYLRETEKELRMKLSLVKTVKLSILLCFIFHFCACAWYLVACDGTDCQKGSWMSIVIKKMIDSNPNINEEEQITIGSRYLVSLYYVTSAVTFTGLSEITPRTQIELCVTIVMIFCTVFVMGFLVGEMTQCLASQVKTKIHFRHKLHVMEHRFMALGLSAPRIEDVRQYFRLLWLRCRGNPYTKILSELPYSLRADITMQVYGSNIKNSKILGTLDDLVIRQLSARVKHEIYMPGAHIIRTGDVCSAVYFIKKGEVVIMDENANLQLCVDILYENECFGEVKVILSREQFRFSYVARLETEVGVLFRDDITEVLSRHHGLMDDMLSRANRIKGQRVAIKDEEDRIGLHTLSSGSNISIHDDNDHDMFEDLEEAKAEESRRRGSEIVRQMHLM